MQVRQAAPVGNGVAIERWTAQLEITLTGAGRMPTA
jgi:hypothetical protein